jgi:hypothetical protein
MLCSLSVLAAVSAWAQSCSFLANCPAMMPSMSPNFLVRAYTICRSKQRERKSVVIILDFVFNLSATKICFTLRIASPIHNESVIFLELHTNLVAE